MISLSKTLSLFREALSQPITVRNVDSLIATSMLLVHHAWNNIDVLQNPLLCESSNPSGPETVDFSLDPLFALCDGLRDIFLHSIIVMENKQSIFAASVIHRPRDTLLRAVHDGNVLSELESSLFKAISFIRNSHAPKFFSSESSLSRYYQRCAAAWEENKEFPPSCDGNEDQETEEALLDASSRLALILAVCRNLANEEISGHIINDGEDSTSPPLPDLARYVFSFHSRSAPRFVALVRQNDPSALLLLRLFYRAVRLLIPTPYCWWAQNRVKFLVGAIDRVLSKEQKTMLDPTLAGLPT